ncbi:MAG: hypothetical protein ACKO5R_00245 [Planctomycetaceae bacterium]
MMATRVFFQRHVRPALMGAAWCVLAVLVGVAAAQPGGKARPKPANPEVKKIDAKMEKVKDSFLRDTENLIKSYEDAGSYDRARMILEALQKLYPQNEKIKERIEELSSLGLNASEIDFTLDVSKSWQEVGPVQKDRALRIRVAGDYKINSLTLSSSPEGITGENPDNDVLAYVPFGAVMGAIIPVGGAGGNEKPPKPFLIGNSFEKPAERDGVLFLKVNVPAQAKCTGRLQVKVGGTVTP